MRMMDKHVLVALAGSLCLAILCSCGTQRHPEIRPLTMPKANTEGHPFEVAIFHGCYDGDTCTVSLAENIPALFGDHITVRLTGIDTPEIKGMCEQEKVLARQAQALTQKLMVQAMKIELLEPRRDKYFPYPCKGVLEAMGRPSRGNFYAASAVCCDDRHLHPFAWHRGY